MQVVEHLASLKDASDRFLLSLLTFDNRGIGGSTVFKKKKNYTTHIMAHDTLALLDHLKWGRVHLVGMSLGGENLSRSVSSIKPLQKIFTISLKLLDLSAINRAWGHRFDTLHFLTIWETLSPPTVSSLLLTLHKWHSSRDFCKYYCWIACPWPLLCRLKILEWNTDWMVCMWSETWMRPVWNYQLAIWLGICFFSTWWCFVE